MTEPQDDDCAGASVLPDTALPPGLYLVGTPIGHLGDITLRALETLKQVDAILAEDTRHTIKLLSHYEIHTPLISCHKFNEAKRSHGIIERIQAGAALALVSDAGMPGVSDPGGRVVAACREAGCDVFVVPGASAVTSAIALSGIGGDRFHFEGFLSPKSTARRRRLGELLTLDYPVVIYESTHRAMKLLDELAELAPDRRIFVGRELTKKFEQSRVSTAVEMRDFFSTRTIKGEWVIVIGPDS